jgi:hypothetical protein
MHVQWHVTLHCGQRPATLREENWEIGHTEAGNNTYHYCPKMGPKLQLNPDPVLRTAESGPEQKLRDIAQAARINWPITKISQTNEHNAHMKEKEIRE